ncbi:MAG: sigma-70 family RNA polymerase sigma factor [Solirubrobacterales bacterium]
MSGIENLDRVDGDAGSNDSSTSAAGGGRERRAIAALRRGQMDALHYLYVRHSDAVFGIVRSVVRDHHDAEDVSQSVFAKLPRIIGRYEERSVPFRAWIVRVARNAALDHVRANRQIPVEEVRAPDTGSDHGRMIRSRALLAGLSQLPPEQRLVIAMRHFAGMPPGEIAAELNKSEPSIHGLHHRGRAALREILTDLDVSPTTAKPA